jgi:hypothetical protein
LTESELLELDGDVFLDTLSQEQLNALTEEQVGLLARRFYGG